MRGHAATVREAGGRFLRIDEPFLRPPSPLSDRAVRILPSDGENRAAVASFGAGRPGQPHRAHLDGGGQPAAVDLPARARRPLHRGPHPALRGGPGLGLSRPRAAVPVDGREHSERGDAPAPRVLHHDRNRRDRGRRLVRLLLLGLARHGVLSIYHRPCRSWVRQKLFAFGMFAVVLLFIVASVTVPALQSCSSRAPTTCRSGSRRCTGSSTGSRSRPACSCCSSRCARRTGSCRAAAVPWHSVWPGAARRHAGHGRRRLRLPALPAERHDPARGHDVRVRADRARVVLRAGDHPARRRRHQRAALRARRAPRHSTRSTDASSDATGVARELAGEPGDRVVDPRVLVGLQSAISE